MSETMKLKDKILFPFRVIKVFCWIVIVFLYAWITGSENELDF